jgi:tRNA G10  N-methylase Trm11
MTIPHPAKYSPSIKVAISDFIWQEAKINTPEAEPENFKVLDPFAGVGNIHALHDQFGIDTYGIELEPEWANQHPRSDVGNALDLPFRDNFFDAIVTSPTYGNRMADHHNAKDGSKRHTYKHYLGRDLSNDSSAMLYWGPEYKEFHVQAWAEASRVLKVGGMFLLNISDHIRKGERMLVSNWHLTTLFDLQFVLEGCTLLDTHRQGHGRNGQLRVKGEMLYALRKVA